MSNSGLPGNTNVLGYPSQSPLRFLAVMWLAPHEPVLRVAGTLNIERR